MKNPKIRNETSTHEPIQNVVSEYLSHLGFNVERNVEVTLGPRRFEADVVAYLDVERKIPHVAVEIKTPLSKEPTLLDSSVQQAFSIATALGDEVRFLLITDGTRKYWFERDAQTQSLEPIAKAPNARDVSVGLDKHGATLNTVRSSERYLQLLQVIVDKLRGEGLVLGLRMGIEINRILIAKIHDEQIVAMGGESRLSELSDSAEAMSEIVRSLYNEAIIALGGTPKTEGLWSLSPRALRSVLQVLQPYSISSVSREFRDLTFWKIFPVMARRQDWQYMTPSPLAELLIKLSNPIQGESVIDPACGTGLLLLEALRHVESQTGSLAPTPLLNLVGLELNSEVAELASTNFALSQIPPQSIHNANSLDPHVLEIEMIKQGEFDLVLMNPPIGPIPKSYPIPRDLIARERGKVSFESLFIQRAFQLLKSGGRIGVFVPEAFLSSSSYEWARSWMLQHATLRAIISLPPESFMPVGHSGKASILIIEKRRAQNSDEILVVDLQAIGYDRFGKPTRENDVPEVLELLNKFNRGVPLGIQDVFSRSDNRRTRAWTLKISDLDSGGLDLAKLDPRGFDLLHALLRGPYPIQKLEEVVDIISGRNVKAYVDDGSEAALLIQAGNVKEAEVELKNAPYISIDDYWSTSRGQVKPGDVLVTTTGAYLGRAALVDRLPRPAVASSAVTILRPTPELDPSYLEALLNSEIGREQISRLRAAASAQPFIRRKDFGELLVPLPPLTHQKAIANRISEMLTKARDLAEQARDLEGKARQAVVLELLEGTENE
jgi:type I restriction enzyme M protein